MINLSCVGAGSLGFMMQECVDLVQTKHFNLVERRMAMKYANHDHENPRIDVTIGPMKHADDILDDNPKFALMFSNSGVMTASITQTRQLAKRRGYTTSIKILKSTDYEVPVTKKRVYLACFPHGTTFKWPKPQTCTKTISDVFGEPMITRIYHDFS